MRGFTVRRWIGALALAGLGPVTASCSDYDCTGEGVTLVCGPHEKTPLALVKVPEGSTLPTSRAVNVRAEVAPSVVPASDIAPFEIQTMSGRVLYQGPLRADQPLQVRVSLATRHDRLVGILHTHGTPLRSEAAVIDGAAAVSFK